MKNRLLLYIGGAVALLVAVAGVAYGATIWGVNQLRDKPEVIVERPVQPGVVVDLGEFVTNLADSSGRRLVKVRFVLEVVDEKAQALLEENRDRARSAVLGLLRGKTVADLHGSEGHQALELEVRDVVNLVVTDAKVRAAYATDLVVQ